VQELVLEPSWPTRKRSVPKLPLVMTLAAAATVIAFVAAPRVARDASPASADVLLVPPLGVPTPTPTPTAARMPSLGNAAVEGSVASAAPAADESASAAANEVTSALLAAEPVAEGMSPATPGARRKRARRPDPAVAPILVITPLRQSAQPPSWGAAEPDAEAPEGTSSVEPSSLDRNAVLNPFQ
jgi:hypothetical protein